MELNYQFVLGNIKDLKHLQWKELGYGHTDDKNIITERYYAVLPGTYNDFIKNNCMYSHSMVGLELDVKYDRTRYRTIEDILSEPAHIERIRVCTSRLRGDGYYPCDNGIVITDGNIPISFIRK